MSFVVGYRLCVPLHKSSQLSNLGVWSSLWGCRSLVVVAGASWVVLLLVMLEL